MNNFSRILPGVVLGMAVIYLLMVAIQPSDRNSQFQLTEFGKLPVVKGGRVQPLDSVARNSLMIISSRQEFKDEKDVTQPAIKWLADAMTGGEMGLRGPAGKHKVFRIDNEQVLGMLALEHRPGSYRYSMEELMPKFGDLLQQHARIRQLQKEGKPLDLFDEKVAELAKHLQIYADLTRWEEPYAVPPAHEGEDWKPLAVALAEAGQGGERNPATMSLGSLLFAYKQNKPDDFNRGLAEYQKWLAENRPEDAQATSFESSFNHAAPFYHAAGLYVIVFVLAVVALATGSETLRQTAFWLMALTVVVHTFGILARMWIQGRPAPITNLYSTAVFIGWACVLTGLVLERIYHNSIGAAVAAALGAGTAVIGHHLASTGDTLEMMQAVLDTNFWLATHVTTINLGYAATASAGFLGVAYVLLGVFTRRLDTEAAKTLSQMLYGVLCLSLLLSFVGTVLGGLWADQSWGRFWGWDPKENGALLIVIWSALILHARWAGMIKQRGMAVLSIAGIMVTVWSWFGTNQLGVGLHAYGFNNALRLLCNGVWMSSLALIAVGLVPLRMWASHAVLTAPLRGGGAGRRR